MRSPSGVRSVGLPSGTRSSSSAPWWKWYGHCVSPGGSSYSVIPSFCPGPTSRFTFWFQPFVGGKASSHSWSKTFTRRAGARRPAPRPGPPGSPRATQRSPAPGAEARRRWPRNPLVRSFLLLTEVVDQKQRLAAVRREPRLGGHLAEVGVLDDLGRDADACDDVADGLVGVVADPVRTLRPEGEVHRVALLELPLALRCAERRPAPEHHQQLL